MADNQKILDSGVAFNCSGAGGHIFTQQFWDNFLCMSGAGVVIGLIHFILHSSQNQNHYVA